MAPNARLVFAPSPTPLPPLSPSSTPDHPPRKPLPPLPVQEVAGPFMLLPEGGVLVAGTGARIERGTAVARSEREGAPVDAKEERGLSWDGTNVRGVAGCWTVWLQGATENDLTAVHRILSFLPPAPSACPAPPAPLFTAPSIYPVFRPSSTTATDQSYRNSLILYSEQSCSVIGVIPLSIAPPHQPAEPAPTTPHLRPQQPSPTFHPAAADFAAYIDHIVDGLSPDPTADDLADEGEARRAKAQKLADAEEQESAVLGKEGSPALVPLVDYHLDVGPSGAAHFANRADDFVRLDLEMELAPDAPSSPRCRSSTEHEVAHRDHHEHLPSSPTRETSTASMSSFVTFSSQRFATADEGDATVAQPGGRSSQGLAKTTVSEPSPSSGLIKEEDGWATGNDSTPRPTLLLPPVAATSVVPSLPPPPFHPTETLTKGNAVLLSFLNTPSSLLPSASSIGLTPTPRVAATAHPLSQDEASRRSLRGEIVLAEMSPPPASGGGEEKEGWWRWLSGMWPSGGDAGDIE